jgi:hypothetical protein
MKKNAMMLICCLFLMVAVLIPGPGLGSVDSLNISKVNSIFIPFCPPPTCRMAIQGQRAFVIACEWDFSDYHLEIIDPERERPVAYWDYGDIISIAVSGDYAYIGVIRDGFGGFGSFLLILNISDLENITTISELRVYGALDKIVVSGDYAYVLMLRRFQVIDVSDPENPEALGYSSSTTSDLNDLDVVGNYAYILKRDGTLFIMDISDPTDPEVTSSYRYNFDFSGRVAVEGENCYVIGDNTLHVLDIWEPHLPVQTGSLDIQWCQTLAAGDGHCYISGGCSDSAYVYVIDQESLAITGYYIYHRRGMLIRDMVVTTDYCYVLYSFGSYYKIDVLDCSQALPVQEHRQDTPTSFSLNSIYPNPFNATATISYSLPSPTSTVIEIFNQTGQLVQDFSVPGQAGLHQFFWDASGLASGTYFLRVSAGNTVATRQAVLLK